MDEKNERDEFHLTAITPEGQAVGIRKRGNEETLGILCPVTDGQTLKLYTGHERLTIRNRTKETLGILCPVTDGQTLMPGVELVTSKKRDNEDVLDLKTLYSVRKGPSKVSTPAYRTNHDRIFKTDKTLN